MRKISLMLLVGSALSYQHVCTMNPFKLFKVPHAPTVYIINGQRRTHEETTVEQRLENHDINALIKRGCGFLWDGYEEWRTYQNIEMLEKFMREPTSEFYHFVFWTRNIDFIKDFISKAPRNMNLVPGLFYSVQTDNPVVVKYLIEEKNVDYMKPVEKGMLIQSSWDRAFETSRASKCFENLRVIYEYDKKTGGKNLKYFRSGILSFLNRKLAENEKDEFIKNYYRKNLDFVEQ